jgi:hypothetical protein
MLDEIVPDIDLGDDHYLVFTRWAPEDLPANRERYGAPLPVVEKWGAIIRHYNPNGQLCESCIQFDGPEQRRVHALHVRDMEGRGEKPAPYIAWTVESWEPLTCSPSLLCHCGDHGFIRGGKWVRA